MGFDPRAELVEAIFFFGVFLHYTIVGSVVVHCVDERGWGSLLLLPFPLQMVPRLQYDFG